MTPDFLDRPLRIAWRIAMLGICMMIGWFLATLAIDAWGWDAAGAIVFAVGLAIVLVGSVAAERRHRSSGGRWRV
jgi:hypothetical protein